MKKVVDAVRSESGAILVMAAALVAALSLLFAGLAEFGRYMILREQTQTAADAAALAAALSGAKRVVKIDVYTDRGEEEYCVCDDDGCSCWCEDCGVVKHTVTGYEKDLIDRGGWRDYCQPPCSCTGEAPCWYVVRERWVEYSPSASREAAESFLSANAPSQAESVWLSRLNVHASRSDPFYPSVTAYAASVMKSLFPGLFGAFPDEYRTEACSQGGTFYRDPDLGRWIEAPPEACWND